MPFSLSFLRVFLMWLFRARALRCCVYCMVLAVCSNNLADARPLSHQLCTRADTASWTWYTVNSEFFSPKAITNSSQEQITDTGQYQVPLKSDVTAALPSIQADVLFLVLETAFNAPAREGNQQQLSDGSVARRVTEKRISLRLRPTRYGQQPGAKSRQADPSCRAE